MKLTNDVPLSSAETKTLEPFIVEVAGVDAQYEDAVDDFATTILQSAKKPRQSLRAAVNYSDLLKIIPSTGNRCERLLLQCKLILTHNRSPLLPANFEMMVFFRVNKDMWNAETLLGMKQ